MTESQIMFADLILTKIITLGGMLAKVKDMTDEEVEAEIAKWEVESDREMARLNDH